MTTTFQSFEEVVEIKVTVASSGRYWIDFYFENGEHVELCIQPSWKQKLLDALQLANPIELVPEVESDEGLPSNITQLSSIH